MTDLPQLAKELAQMLLNPGSEVGFVINILIAVVAGICVLLSGIIRIRLILEGSAITRIDRRAQTVWERYTDPRDPDFDHMPSPSDSEEEGGELAIEGGDDEADEEEEDEIERGISDNEESSEEEVWRIRDRLLDGVSPRRLGYRRTQALVRLRDVSSEAMQALSKADEDDAHVHLAMPRYLATVPILLGLTGTLWGLSIAVVEIQPLIASISDLKQLPDLLDAMGETLKGMKTAFVTSISGLLAGMLLSLLTTRVSRAYQKMLSRLEQVCALELIPLLSIPEERRAITRFSESLATSARQLDESTKNIDRWTGNLVDAVGHTRDGADRLLQTAASFSNGAATLERFQTEFQERYGTQQTDLNASLDAVSKSLASIDGLLASHSAQRSGEEERFKTLTEENQKAMAGLKELVDSIITDNKRVADEVIKELNETVEALTKKSTEAMTTAVETLDSASKAAASDNADAVADAVQGVIDDSRQSLVDLFDALRDSLARDAIGSSRRTPPLADAGGSPTMSVEGSRHHEQSAS